MAPETQNPRARRESPFAIRSRLYHGAAIQIKLLLIELIHWTHRPFTNAFEHLGSKSEPWNMSRALGLKCELLRDGEPFDPGLRLLDRFVDQFHAHVTSGAWDARIELKATFDKRTVVRISPQMKLEHCWQFELVHCAFKLGIGRRKAAVFRYFEPLGPESGWRGLCGHGVTAFLEHVHQHFVAKERGQAMQRLRVGFEQINEKFDQSHLFCLPIQTFFGEYRRLH